MARQAELCLKSIFDGSLSTSPATQQVRRAETVPTHLSHCRPGEQRCARVTILAGSRPEGAYLNAQDPVVKLDYRTHEGTHLRSPESSHRYPAGTLPTLALKLSSKLFSLFGRFRLFWRFLPPRAVLPQVDIRPESAFLPQ